VSSHPHQSSSIFLDFPLIHASMRPQLLEQAMVAGLVGEPVSVHSVVMVNRRPSVQELKHTT